MSRWNDRGWSQPPKLPPPKHGIRVKKAGTTWWGRQWIAALERMSAGYSNRLARGIGYARAGRTHDVVVTPGLVTAQVTGSRAKPYEVRIRLRVLSDRIWNEAVAAMAREARFSAELLAGEMPQGVDAAFAAARASLFPSAADDLEATCTCPDWASPCKHVAAIHYMLGEAFDRDPFVLFQLRGREKEQVIEALRAARAPTAAVPRAPTRRKARNTPEAPAAAAGRGPASESLKKLPVADYGKARAPLPALSLAFAPPQHSGGVVEHLGKPQGWSAAGSPADSLGGMIRAGAQRARALAIADPLTVLEPADEGERPPARKAT